MAVNEYPLSLVVRAVDRATGPLRKINKLISRVTAPTRRLGNRLEVLGEAAGLPKLTEGFKGMGSAIHKVGGAAFDLGAKMVTMAGIAGFALFSIVHGAVEAGDELAMMADRVGLTVDAYASLRHAANLADVDQEEFNSALDKFNKNLGAAKAGTGPLLELLKKVSPVMAEQIKKVKGTEEGLSLLTDAFARLPDTQRQAELSSAAFGKSSTQMGRFMHQGSAAIQKQQIEFMRLSGSQEEFANRASDLDNAMKNTTAAFLGLRSAAGGALFPALVKVAGVVTEFLVRNRDGVKVWATETAGAINAWVDGGGIARLAAMFQRFSATVSPIVERLGGWPVVVAGVGTAILAGPLLGALASLAGAFVTLGVAVMATPLGWALALLALVAGAATFALAKDEALHQNTMTRIKALGEQKNALDDVAFAQEQLNAAMGRDSATPTEIETLADQLASAKKAATVATKAASSAVHDDPTSLGALGLGAIGLALDAAGARPAGGSGGAGQSTNRVQVDFANLPKGARVTQDSSNTAPVDLSLGYSMVTP